MGRITDSWSGKQKFHVGFGKKGNTKLDEYQKMLVDDKGKELKSKNSKLSFEERLKRARDPIKIRANKKKK
tara:strand:+ start:51 stop:263 length:213 start_codon:yes stop_codon:yes gene_type:complete